MNNPAPLHLILPPPPFHWSCRVLWPDKIKRRAVTFSESGFPAEGEAIIGALNSIREHVEQLNPKAS